jgi:hypothetical protein
MKCIRNNQTGEIRRLSNDRAEELVAKPEWTYTSKGHWKNAPNTTWVKSSTPPNPMSPAKVHRKELKNRAYLNRSK